MEFLGYVPGSLAVFYIQKLYLPGVYFMLKSLLGGLTVGTISRGYDDAFGAKSD